VFSADAVAFGLLGLLVANLLALLANIVVLSINLLSAPHVMYVDDDDDDE